MDVRRLELRGDALLAAVQQREPEGVLREAERVLREPLVEPESEVRVPPVTTTGMPALLSAPCTLLH